MQKRNSATDLISVIFTSEENIFCWFLRLIKKLLYIRKLTCLTDIY